MAVVGESKNDSTGMFTVKVSIPNSDNKIKVGMLADVRLVTDKSDNVLVIDENSILKSGDETYVYVAKGKKAKKKVITTGASDGEKIEVLSGLNDGDKVVVDGKEYLSDKNNEIKITSK